MDITYPVTIVSDLHVGHPATKIKSAEELAPLFRGAATVIFNGDTVEMLWLINREKALVQLEQLAEVCLAQGARPIFLNGNHDPVVSSASHVDLCGGAVLVTHGDLLFHEIAPWSHEAKVLGPEHTRVLDELTREAHSDFEERLIAVKRTSLALEMHEPKRPDGRFVALATALREGWPPWRALQIVACWMRTPAEAVRLADRYRPDARFVIVGHTHYAGIWKRGRRVIVNTGSFLPFSGRSAVRLDGQRMEVLGIVRRKDVWDFGRSLGTYATPNLTTVG